ncbi:hypothetical protein CS063_05015 [Sporanaerobium hydrogeniformans]|uniref:Uncharacterized protein n=1 Tax=Sporanaerobium hydrogeniformans TaxID=3072179 RepID=A0AC61DFC4_9FIRM|nr:glucosaminidase domain-containing protein [Sporanaerobium hydrogeniformans]PHV71411.1 hypothetical protein CS063_05015 [Sporanaerobium hydrogeniformans]
MNVLETLQTKELITDDQIHILKTSIRQKYPYISSHDSACLFAKAVHELLNQNLKAFNKEECQRIKRAVLEQAITRDAFSINYLDIFKVCSILQEENPLLLTPIATWLSAHHPKALSMNEVQNLLTELTPSRQLTPSIASTRQTSYLPLFMELVRKVWTYLKTHKVLMLQSVTLIFLTCTLSYSLYRSHEEKQLYIETMETLAIQPLAPPIRTESNEETPSLESPLQPELRYKDIDELALTNWLTNKQSLLAKTPYFDSIMAVAEEFNINPLLLFAITGQEQGFVPVDHHKASTIANNPFNVYGSWQDFNTNITDTSRIAARTILNLSKDCPPDEDPIKWLNRKYAEDPNWHIGVSQILTQLEEVAGQSK